jgi:hypothetical protein
MFIKMVTLLGCKLRCPVRISDSTPSAFTEVLSAFSVSPRVTAREAWQPSSTCFQHIIQSFNATHSEIFTSLKKQEIKVKCTAMRGGPQCYETKRLLHLLDNWFTEGGEVVSLKCLPVAFYPQEYSWYSFLLQTESTPGPYCGWKH